VNERSNQQTLGIIVFAYPFGVQKSLFCFCTQDVFQVTAIVLMLQ